MAVNINFAFADNADTLTMPSEPTTRRKRQRESEDLDNEREHDKEWEEETLPRYVVLMEKFVRDNLHITLPSSIPDENQSLKTDPPSTDTTQFRLLSGTGPRNVFLSSQSWAST